MPEKTRVVKEEERRSLLRGPRSDNAEAEAQADAIFNGVKPEQMDAKPSVDTGADIEDLAESNTSEVVFSQDSTSQPLAGRSDEDISKSRDSKAGGLTAPETKREASIREAQKAAPEAPGAVPGAVQPKAEPGFVGQPNAAPAVKNPTEGKKK